MKNFTNNFKQLTSRLSARWLIMALMLLVGTSSAWAWTVIYDNTDTQWDEVYLYVGKGDWSQCDLKMTEYDTNLFFYNGGGWDDATEIAFGNASLSGSTSGAICSKLKSSSDATYTYDKDFSKTYKYKASGVKGSAKDCGIYRNIWPNSNARVEVTFHSIQLAGSFNNWQNSTDICYTNGNSCSIDVELSNGTHTFKIVLDGTWYGNGGTINNTISGWDFTTSGNDCSIKVTKAGTYTFTFDASTKKLSVEYPPACTTPKDSHLTYTDPKYTYDGNTKTAEVKWADDGTNTGITIKYGSDTTAPKNAGNYDLKVSTGAHGDLCPSQEDISLGTFTISPKTPDVNDFVYTNQTVTYNGYAQTANVTWKQGYEKTGAITITYKQGDEIKDPINAGTYDVWVTSVASENFRATESEINKGTLKIDLAEITDVPNNFQLSKTSYNYGEEAKPTVSLKQGSSLVAEGLGAITTKYYNSSDQEVTNPTAVGTYTVKITMTAGNGYSAITEPTVVGTFDITCYKPINPTLSKTDVTRCNGEPKTTGTITITNYAQYPEGCVFYLDGTIVTPTNEGVIENVYFPTENSKTYTVKVTNTCGSTIQESDETQIAIKATDVAPSIGDFEIKYNVSSVCSGSIVQLEATHVNGATYAWYKGNSQDAIAGATDRTYSPSITENSTYRVTVTKTSNGCSTTKEAITETIIAIPQADAPQITPNYMNVCSGDAFKLPNIDGVTWSLDGKTTTGSQPGIANNTDEAIIKTFQAVKEVDGCPSEAADYIVTVNPTPVITGESVAQPGKLNGISLKLQGNLVADWSVDPTADLSYTTNSNSTKFSAETNDTYTIKATTKEGCSATHSVTVKDASYVYVRRPKEGDGTNVYTNWYANSSVAGGPLYIKSGAITAGNASANNEGGNLMTEAFTDCKGFIWDRYEIATGQTQFHVHAANEKAKDGYATFSQAGIITDDQDYYFTLSSWATSQYGVTITETSDPRKPTVYALGSTTLGTDEFAALYVTDCSGKEITGYQWYKDEQPYSSVCSYVGKKGEENSDAGQTNNIRPTELGYYRCEVTYGDETTATSAAVKIDGTYNRSFTSTIPVLVVNTGDEDFPGCQASGADNYPSKYADELKAKRSVDVKIYDGEGALVYDRKARMAYRGSSSLNFTKKSYAFCPGKANCGDEDKGADYVKTEKLNMLGVGNAVDKDWVLYAAAADPSLMRNRMVFDTYQAMRNDWGVHSRYVELIVDGDYKGVYVFMDKITMNENRVEVNEDNGFIVKFDKTDCADRVGGYGGIIGDEKTFSTERTGRYGISTYHTTVDQLFEIEYPEKDDYPTGWASKVATIKGMFQAFEDALEAGDYATVQKYIDYDSWADWFIINEFTKNLDAYRASCIFVYTGEAGAKIEARPLWDQELSFNNAAANISGKGANSTSGLLIQNEGVYTDCFPAPFWFTGQLATFGNCGVNNGSGGKGDKLANCLLNDPCFVQVVKEKWNQHQFGALSAEKLNALVTKYTNELGDAALERESSKWPNDFRTSADCNAGDTGYKSVSYSDSKTAITSWIADGAGGRSEGLTTAINGLTGTSFSIQIIPSGQTVTPWEPANISIAVTPAGYDYKLEYTGDNNLGGVVNTIIEKEGNSISYRIPRPKSWGTGDETTDGEREDVVYGIKATLNVAEGNMECGSSAAPYSEAEIALTDEDNEKCPQ